MQLKVLTTQVEIHTTPLESISMDTSKITLEFDDSTEKRWRASFCPYQGFKVSTIDCYATKQLLVDGKRPFYLLEVINSRWIMELHSVLKAKDETADFLNKAHHYIFPFQDIIVEVVAWDNFKLEEIRP
ncbi:hypothetical protein [Phosphitispora fastidiosa]|uniref:hypothetical protein n=1 Tax=Phosphitispora fastidiosa TaxID=2837202 RepID=UPI001E550EEF|nr:hypothetical protein [Phosphitispora fastidiosa]MBU7008875.1 hypothetical protein [Phosphitispora fastidiosa]